MRGGPGSVTSSMCTEGLNMSKERTVNNVYCCKDIGED